MATWDNPCSQHNKALAHVLGPVLRLQIRGSTGRTLREQLGHWGQSEQFGQVIREDFCGVALPTRGHL